MLEQSTSDLPAAAFPDLSDPRIRARIWRDAAAVVQRDAGKRRRRRATALVRRRREARRGGPAA